MIIELFILLFQGFFGLIFVLCLVSIKVIKEYERGVVFTLGKYAGIKNPGLRFVIPLIQTWNRIDMRVKVLDVPDQDAITKDNVTLNVNAVIYFKVIEANKAVIEVENYMYAVSQLAQTTMRDVVGEVSLDDLLSKRDAVSGRIRQIVDHATDPWGIKIEAVELKHVELPAELRRVISKEAESERERRAVIIKAAGEVSAATNMAKAAKTLAASPGALHLRTLQSINDMSSDQSNTIVFAVPLEVLRSFEGKAKK